MRTIVLFLLGVATGVAGLLVWQHPNTAIILGGLFPTHQQAPQIVVPTTGCEPARLCEKSAGRRIQ
jgi:hypothetical protein